MTFILSEGGNFFQHLYFVLVYNVLNNLSQYNNENVRKTKYLKAPKKIMVNASQVLFQTVFYFNLHSSTISGKHQRKYIHQLEEV